jgi:hypothetical protein
MLCRDTAIGVVVEGDIGRRRGVIVIEIGTEIEAC